MKKLIIMALAFFGFSTAWAEDILDRNTYKQEICLAKNIYFEARGSSFADKIAVADVVLNRVAHRKYPDTICEVVEQAKMSTWWKETHGKDVPIRHKCQFSWFCDGKPDVPTEKDAWVEAQRIAYIMSVIGNFVGITEGATHYHAHYVNPHWAKHFNLVGTIGNHIFYRQY